MGKSSEHLQAKGWPTWWAFSPPCLHVDSRGHREQARPPAWLRPPVSCETRGLGRPRNLGWDPHVPTCDFGQYPNFLGPGALSLEMRLISPARAITESEKENGQDAPGQSSVPSESHVTVT